MKEQIRAVIFDMDGVIIDSEPHHEQSFREIFSEMGFQNETHGIHFPDYYGRSDEAVWRDFIQLHSPSQPLKELLDWKQRHFLNRIEKLQPIFSDIPLLVSDLAQHYTLGLASGSLHAVIRAVLSMHNLRPHFKAVTSVEDVARGKPAPDVFLNAARLLDIDPTTCCVIEDSQAGVQAGRSAGMQVIAITNTFSAEKLGEAHHVVSSYQQIRELLLP